MSRKRFAQACFIAVTFAVGYLLGGAGETGAVAEAVAAEPPQPVRVFELRTYTAPEGKLDDLLTRFRDHTLRIFEKHGMTNVAYWTPQDDPEAANTLVYVLAHPSREAAEASWRAFGSDPEWQQVAEESQREGRLITALERVYLDPTDFSPMK